MAYQQPGQYYPQQPQYAQQPQGYAQPQPQYVQQPQPGYGQAPPMQPQMYAQQGMAPAPAAYGQQPMMQQQMQPAIGTTQAASATATLGFLSQVPGLLVRQKINKLDMAASLVGMDNLQGNKYEVKPLPPGFDVHGESTLSDEQFRSLPTYFLGLEESDLCARQCCGPARGFQMHLKDASGQDVLRFKRPFNCTIPCCLPPCLGTYLYPQEIEIYTMATGGFEGPKIASVKQSTRLCSLSHVLEVYDANGALIFLVTGYALQCGPNCCCRTFEFNVEFPDGNPTGAMLKNVFPGCNFRGLCTKADNLMLTFPPTASPEHRAALLGAAFLIDFMFFETRDDGGAAV